MMQTIQCKDCDSIFEYDEEKQRIAKCPNCKAEVVRVGVFVVPNGNHAKAKYYKGGLETRPNHRILYEDASRLFRRDEYTVSVIIAHTACEVATVRTLHHAIRFNNMMKYYDIIFKSTRSTHIASNEILKWYKLLTDDDSINQQPFWSKLKSFADLRNKIIHEGEKANKEQAQEALEVVIELFKHFGKQRKRFRESTEKSTEVIQ